MAAVRCTHCADVVSDHEPGVSSVIVDGQLFHPGCAPRTWTEHTARCTVCHDLFRVSAEAIHMVRTNLDAEGQSDAEIAATMEFCLECVDGHILPGEKAGLN